VNVEGQKVKGHGHVTYQQ